MVKKARVEPQRRAGRRPSLNAEHTAVLRAITREQPRPSLDEVTREVFQRAGVKVSTVTVRKALREAGIERLKTLRRAGDRAAVQGSAPTRYGYTAAHRRADGVRGMNTDLTDAEWARMAGLFEREGQRGAPARYERRHMVSSCCRALRKGRAWRLLPKTLPPWQALYTAFSRWAAAGVFEADARSAAPAVARPHAPCSRSERCDHRSPRAHAVPRKAATGVRRGKKVKGASATCWWTPWACCCPSRSPPPACKTVTRQPTW